MAQKYRFVLWMCLVLLVAAAPARAAELPPRPADSILDDARLLADDQRVALGEVTARAPIAVITIDNLAAYGVTNGDIEQLARVWLERWKLGPHGVVVLVSVGDRKARIQFGPTYGTAFDADARRIMDHVLIPAFKANTHGRGLVVAVGKLEQLRERGPSPAVEHEIDAFPIVFIVLLFLVPIGIVIAAAALGGSGSSDGGSSSCGSFSSCGSSSSSSSSDSGGGATGSW